MNKSVVRIHFRKSYAFHSQKSYAPSRPLFTYSDKYWYLVPFLFHIPLKLRNTVVHDFNGHEVNEKKGFNGKKCYDGGFYVVNNGKIDV